MDKSPEQQINELKIESYDAWMAIQVANQTLKDNQAKLLQNVQKIAELKKETIQPAPEFVE